MRHFRHSKTDEHLKSKTVAIWTGPAPVCAKWSSSSGTRTGKHWTIMRMLFMLIHLSILLWNFSNKIYFLKYAWLLQLMYRIGSTTSYKFSNVHYMMTFIVKSILHTQRVSFWSFTYPFLFNLILNMVCSYKTIRLQWRTMENVSEM